MLVTQLTPTSVPIHDIDFTQPTAFILGNEVNGARPISQSPSTDTPEVQSVRNRALRIAKPEARPLWVNTHKMSHPATKEGQHSAVA